VGNQYESKARIDGRQAQIMATAISIIDQAEGVILSPYIRVRAKTNSAERRRFDWLPEIDSQAIEDNALTGRIFGITKCNNEF
jgi:hypothetical protein